MTESDRREWVVGDGVARRWQDEADVLANRSVAAGDPTGWFDELYRSAGTGAVAMPWDRDEPNPVLVEWVRERAVTGTGRRAVVIGAGLGMDAEFISSLGFDTTAFDVSPTALANARSRHPKSTVDYVVANLLDPPTAWARAFDLVVEIFTVQAMPRSVRAAAIANVTNLVAVGGTLIVIQGVPPTDDLDAPGPPWLLTRAEIDAFTRPEHGLDAIDVGAVEAPSARRWRAELHRRG
jgi:threonine dehydrogenase-like Zn-dependent dehydrogenase